jgi:methenyltetrahydromethanopterin cyclohydrolase
MISLNERAWQRLERAIEAKDRLKISVRVLDCGTRLVDAGVEAAGGVEAGLALAEIGMADLGRARLELATLNGIPWPWIEVQSDHPLEACYLSQAAHWSVQVDNFRAMGSGPACLLNRTLDPGKPFGFEEKADRAVLVLETRQIPTESVCSSMADTCGVRPDRLALLVAPTSCLAGSAQIAARSVETGLHKLHALGFNLELTTSAQGRCPMAVPTGDDFASLGLTNDLVVFACQVWLSVRGVSDAALADLVLNLPSSTSSSYGLPFIDAIKAAGGFYALDLGLFAPAEATLVNQDNGKIYHAGTVDFDRLAGVLKGYAHQ